ncbi:oligopeptide/dipeptide ABC transporter ATP-binding protein, partial [Klebsiella pneumoniae]|uniref:oligopeptide/dipeptide ABC transporter ATP-binding protein n=1 Tax=Klebsiella pneumoniae TaxID=573 RepID=UPI0034D28C4A
MGKIVEMGGADAMYHNPYHAYSKALLAAIPKADPTKRTHTPVLPGDVPSPIDPPPGSAFGRRVNHPYLEA